MFFFRERGAWRELRLARDAHHVPGERRLDADGPNLGGRSDAQLRELRGRDIDAHPQGIRVAERQHGSGRRHDLAGVEVDEQHHAAARRGEHEFVGAAARAGQLRDRGGRALPGGGDLEPAKAIFLERDLFVRGRRSRPSRIARGAGAVQFGGRGHAALREPLGAVEGQLCQLQVGIGGARGFARDDQFGGPGALLKVASLRLGPFGLRGLCGELRGDLAAVQNRERIAGADCVTLDDGDAQEPAADQRCHVDLVHLDRARTADHAAVMGTASGQKECACGEPAVQRRARAHDQRRTSGSSRSMRPTNAARSASGSCRPAARTGSGAGAPSKTRPDTTSSRPFTRTTCALSTSAAS